MELFDLLLETFDTGVIPSLAAVLLGIATLVLEVAKNKLIKKLSNSEDKVEALEAQVDALKKIIIDLTAMSNNTNAITSAMADMVHIAYANSKLDPAVKLQLQKVYDACPDAKCDESINVEEVILTPATQDQIDSIVVSETKSYADIISEKYE